jgi:TonB family protein
MASPSRTQSEELAIPMVVTICVHVVLGIGLVIAGRFADKPEIEEDTEVDIEPPPPKVVQKIEPPVIVPPPPQIALPEIPKEPPPPAREPQPVREPRVVANPDPTPGPEPEATDPEGAEDGEPPGDPIQLPDVYVSGDVEVGKGKGGGTGGSGGGSGTGAPPPGPETSGPPPVSIAAIKKFAKPIGDVDFIADQHYPDDARRLRIEGEVKVRVKVDDKGKVTDRKLIKKIGHGLDEVALGLAAKLRFEPALDTNDRPVASIVIWTYRFQLPD